MYSAVYSTVAGLKGPDKESLVGGDPRATVQPGLTSLYSLFLNEHNRVAQSLKAVDSSLDDEDLYQRARIIVTAELQNIVYREFLPAVIGPERANESFLEMFDDQNPTKYNPSINPDISNEFATVAFRFGHTLIPNHLEISKFPRQRAEFINCPMKDNFYKTEDFILGSDLSGKAWQNVLVGSSRTDNRPTDSVMNYLFCEDCGLAEGFGQDLYARNIQRGRDHGLPGYNKFREFCDLNITSDWSDKPEEINQQTWDKMKSVYEKVEDIDPYVGGVAEEPVEGGVVGPTFAKIIQQQFKSIMEGDRFFFAHNETMPADLRAMIRKRTLHTVMCDNIEVEELPSNLFNVQSQHERCSNSYKFDFTEANNQLNIMTYGKR